MSFAFTNQSLSSSVIKSYKDPYDAYQNRYENQLSLIINDVIVEHLDTNLISVRWAIACAKRVLPIFESWNLDDKRPRRAIEVAKLWVLQHTANDAANNADAANADAANAANAAYYAAADAYAADAAYAANAAAYAANAAAYATPDYTAAHAAAHAVNAASTTGASKDAEIQWQRSQLRKIIKEHSIYYKKFNKLLYQRYPPELASLIVSYKI